jgi:predicted transposase/invertase (TIGR01784 family)
MPRKIRKDILWKGILEDCFEDFFAFFYPDAVDDFDFSRGVAFLDKELEALFPEAQEKDRIADKLAKVFTADGHEEWVLIHVEVQGYKDEDFSKRMFTYFYRIYDRYQVPVHAIAILTDEQKSYHPRAFEYHFLKTHLQYEFDTFKLKNCTAADFQKTPDNPFSIALELAWESFQKRPDQELLELKLTLIKRLLKAGHNRQKVSRVMDFIKFYLSFEHMETELQLDYLIDLVEGKKEPFGIRERILTELARQYKEEGLQEGREEGRVEGRVEGREEEREELQKTFVQKLHAKGYTIEEIADFLEITPEKVKAILRSLDQTKG